MASSVLKAFKNMASNYLCCLSPSPLFPTPALQKHQATLTAPKAARAFQAPVSFTVLFPRPEIALFTWKTLCIFQSPLELLFWDPFLGSVYNPCSLPS